MATTLLATGWDEEKEDEAGGGGSSGVRAPSLPSGAEPSELAATEYVDGGAIIAMAAMRD